MQTVFSQQAVYRLLALNPRIGDEQFRQLARFAQIAAQHPGQAFIVPPELDRVLHEVLSARPSLEQLPISHYALPIQVGQAQIGRRFCDFDHPDAVRTREKLQAAGFEWSPEVRYAQMPCAFAVNWRSDEVSSPSVNDDDGA